MESLRSIESVLGYSGDFFSALSSAEGGKSSRRQPCCCCPVTVQKEQQGIFRCRAGVGGQDSHEAMESPQALMCPLEKGVRGIETSGSGYLRQQIRGGRKGRAECLY